MANPFLVSKSDRSAIESMSLEDFCEEEVFESLRNWIKLTPEKNQKNNKTFLEIQRHNHFLDHISKIMNFRLTDDLDAGLVYGDLTLNETPDIYEPDFRLWADVSVTYNVNRTSFAKFQKYQKLLIREFERDPQTFRAGYNPEIAIYMFYPSTGQIILHRRIMNPEREIEFFEESLDIGDDDVLNGLQNLTQLISECKDTIEEEDENILESGAIKEIIGNDNYLCKEAGEFYNNDDGVLHDLILNASLDSDQTNWDQFMKELPNKIQAEVVNLKEKKSHFKSAFKPPTEFDLSSAFSKAEKEAQDKFQIILEPKPSCHGFPSLSEVSLKSDLGNTKEAAINRFHKDLKKNQRNMKLNGIFEEVTQSLDERVEEYNTNLENSRSNRSNKEIPVEEKYPRNSQRFKKLSQTYKNMGIGKRHIYKKEKVKTYPFWDKKASLPIMKEIEKKVLNRLPRIIYNIHRDMEPELDSIQEIYQDFLHSELFQEIGTNAILMENILTAAAGPRSKGTFVVGNSQNYLALIGPGSQLLRAGQTVPIQYFSKEHENWVPSAIWMRSVEKCGSWHASQGDRLDKARIESMINAPHLASIAASIIFTTMKGTREELLYAAGVMACICTSVSIKDSELIDHIRYMVPNIFCKLSCAAEYIEEKYVGSLKTQLQALVYQETKDTILQSVAMKKMNEEVEIEDDIIKGGGTIQQIPFLRCIANDVFTLNGVVYTGFFACKKGLHNPAKEMKNMFETICKFENKSKGKDLLEASFAEDSYHRFNPKFIGYGMADMCLADFDKESWRKLFNKNEIYKKPYELATFTSLRSSMKDVEFKDPEKEILKRKERSKGKKNEKTSVKNSNKLTADEEELLQELTSSFVNLKSSDRTKVLDQFYDLDESVIEIAIKIMKKYPERVFHATWDRKLQRTLRDREVFIAEWMFKVIQYVIEMVFKVVCDNNDNELITSAGDMKILNQKNESLNYYKARQGRLKNPNSRLPKDNKDNDMFDFIRWTLDMTKWAPGDNLYKFIYAIAGLPYLTMQEKIVYINMSCVSGRKEVVMNDICTKAIARLTKKGHIKEDSEWAKCLNIVEKTDNGTVLQFEKNSVPIRFSWLMGMLNYASSAVHAVCAHMVGKVLNSEYQVEHYKPGVHSDDAKADAVVRKIPGKPLDIELIKIIEVTNAEACIKVSTKKSYGDEDRVEMVSEVNQNGMDYTYWQKQAMSAISGVGYIDFYKDYSDACSKISAICTKGCPPSVTQVVLSNVISLVRRTYGMGRGQKNNISENFQIPEEQLPIELGGRISMNPYLLPVVGLKYQSFSHMYKLLREITGKKNIEDFTEEDILKLQTKKADLICKSWWYTAELATVEGLTLRPFESSLISYRQFGSLEKAKDLRIVELAEMFSEEELNEILEKDPSLSIRGAQTNQEKLIQIALLLRKPGFLVAISHQSPDQMKLERILNRYGKCCKPVLEKYISKDILERNEEDKEEMMKGRMTLIEAVQEVLEHLYSIEMNLAQVFDIIKSLPLMAYVFHLENDLNYVQDLHHNRKLFPVRKVKSIVEHHVKTSPAALLQILYTDHTKLRISFDGLREDLELCKTYQELFHDLPRKDQALALFKVLQMPMSLNSVVYVPYPKWTGYKMILGLLCISKFDDGILRPVNEVKPFKKEFYFNPFKKTETTVYKKLSDVAKVINNLVDNPSLARDILAHCSIEGSTALDIVDQGKKEKSGRDRMMAELMLKGATNFYNVEDWKILFLSPQTRTFDYKKPWSGKFTAVMVCPEYSIDGKKRTVIFYGKDNQLEEIEVAGSFHEYLDIKKILFFFFKQMHWSLNPRLHMRYQELSALKSDNWGRSVIYYKPYDNNFTFRTATLDTRPGSLNWETRHDKIDGHLYSDLTGSPSIKGLPVVVTPSVIEIPRIQYSSPDAKGYSQLIEWRGHELVMREIFHPISDLPEFDLNYQHAIFDMKGLIQDSWQYIREKNLIETQFLTCYLDKIDGPINLTDKMCQIINQQNSSEWEPLRKKMYNIDEFDPELPNPNVDYIRYESFINNLILDQEAFNLHLSSALISDGSKARFLCFLQDPATIRRFNNLTIEQMYYAIYVNQQSRFHRSKNNKMSISLFENKLQEAMFSKYYTNIFSKQDDLLVRQDSEHSISFKLGLQEKERRKKEASHLQKILEPVKTASWADLEDEEMSFVEGSVKSSSEETEEGKAKSVRIGNKRVTDEFMTKIYDQIITEEDVDRYFENITNTSSSGSKSDLLSVGIQKLKGMVMSDLKNIKSGFTSEKIESKDDEKEKKFHTLNRMDFHTKNKEVVKLNKNRSHIPKEDKSDRLTTTAELGILSNYTLGSMDVWESSKEREGREKKEEKRKEEKGKEKENENHVQSKKEQDKGHQSQTDKFSGGKFASLVETAEELAVFRQKWKNEIEGGNEGTQQETIEQPRFDLLNAHNRSIEIYRLEDNLQAGVIVSNQDFTTRFLEEQIEVRVQLHTLMKHDGNCSIQALSTILRLEQDLIEDAMKNINPGFNPAIGSTWPDSLQILRIASFLDRDLMMISGNQIQTNYKIDEEIGIPKVGLNVDGVFTDLVRIYINWILDEEEEQVESDENDILDF